MGREILKFLYAFYNDGDYVGFHLLTPLFEKLKKGQDFKEYVNRLKNTIGFLSQRLYIELNTTEYGSWGTPKEGSILFDYTHIPLEGRITPEGVENIERVIAQDRQNRVDNSVISTNILTKINIGTTIVFSAIVLFIQIRGV
jgi:hypothetical protein